MLKQSGIGDFLLIFSAATYTAVDLIKLKSEVTILGEFQSCFSNFLH